jgi:hypothetical protein
LRSANVYGFMLGITNSIMFYAVAAAFVLGGFLMEKQLFGLTFEKIMIVFSCVIFGAQSVGMYIYIDICDVYLINKKIMILK